MANCACCKTYKKKKEPLDYEIAFDGVEYSKEEQMFLWQQLIETLLRIKQSTKN